jgi:hypothetical protein
MQLSSQDSGQRKSAKSAIKQKILEEFKRQSSLSAEDLKNFHPIFKAISANLVS